MVGAHVVCTAAEDHKSASIWLSLSCYLKRLGLNATCLMQRLQGRSYYSTAAQRWGQNAHKMRHNLVCGTLSTLRWCLPLIMPASRAAQGGCLRRQSRKPAPMSSVSTKKCTFGFLKLAVAAFSPRSWCPCLMLGLRPHSRLAFWK